MNVRHAAALALVGWYLMVPPMHDAKWYGVERAAKFPVSRWEPLPSYDSALECESGKLWFQQKAKKDEHKSESDHAFYGYMLQAQCIASDDPRLKP
jgi:hypothetical protein